MEKNLLLDLERQLHDMGYSDKIITKILDLYVKDHPEIVTLSNLEKSVTHHWPENW